MHSIVDKIYMSACPKSYINYQDALILGKLIFCFENKIVSDDVTETNTLPIMCIPELK